MNDDCVVIKRKDHWLEPFRIEYDSKYITLFGKDKNYECLFHQSAFPNEPPEYEEMVLPYSVDGNGCIEIRNAQPFIKSVTEKTIIIQMHGAW